MVEFASGVKGMALNLENDNVGVVVFGNDRSINEGDIVKRTGAIIDTPSARASSAASSTRYRPTNAPSGPLTGDVTRQRIEVKAPDIIPRQSPERTARVLSSLVPVGRGMLGRVVGDRQTGKTAVAIGDHQPEVDQRDGRQDQVPLLHLRRPSVRALDRRAADEDPHGQRRDGLLDHRRRHRLRASADHRRPPDG